jgi:hypothetical protein
MYAGKQLHYQHRAELSAAWSKVLNGLVDLIGIEPMTSSMPWNRKNRKL